MNARIVAIANQKGGSGKTTVTMNLAGALVRRGKKVLIVDADAQATATRWAASALDNNPFPAMVVNLSAAGGKLHREVKRLVGDYEYILIDCPPAADSPVPHSALLVADLVIVPVIPSPPDLWAAVGIREVIEHVGIVNENLQARLLVNQCQSQTTMSREVVELLPEYQIEVLQTYFHFRTVYKRSAAYGQSVHIFGAKAESAINEVESLSDEVLNIVSGGQQV